MAHSLLSTTAVFVQPSPLPATHTCVDALVPAAAPAVAPMDERPQTPMAPVAPQSPSVRSAAVLRPRNAYDVFSAAMAQRKMRGSSFWGPSLDLNDRIPTNPLNRKLNETGLNSRCHYFGFRLARNSGN